MVRNMFRQIVRKIVRKMFRKKVRKMLDDLDKSEIKYGFYMALHHPFAHRGKFAFSMIKYSLGIIWRRLL